MNSRPVKILACVLLVSQFGWQISWATGSEFSEPSLPPPPIPVACSIQEFSANMANVPLCPEHGTLLPENYPAMFVSVSDDRGIELAENFVDHVFQAQPSPAPLIFFNATPEHFEELKTHLRSQAWATAQMIANISLVTGVIRDEFGGIEPVTFSWQQDFVRGFFDRQTGRPQPRFVQHYPNVGTLPINMQNQFNACSIHVDAPIHVTNENEPGGFSGGNIDSVLPNLCLVGRAGLTAREWEAHSRNICGDALRVEAPTSWSRAQHVDEIFKMIPRPVAEGESPACGFALAFASPRQALLLLRQHSQEVALGLPSMSDSDFESQIDLHVGMNIACAVWDYQKMQAEHLPYLYPNENQRLQNGHVLHFPVSIEHPHYPGETHGPQYNCKLMTNLGLYQTIRRDLALNEFNRLAQAQMDTFKAELLMKVHRALPQCHIQTIDVPQLFTGPIDVAPSGSHSLPSAGDTQSGSSIFPNPTNGVFIGRTYMMPEPYNAAFKADLLQKLTGLGINVEFIDTFDAHHDEGNLHCLTQVFRYCRPR